MLKTTLLTQPSVYASRLQCSYRMCNMLLMIKLWSFVLPCETIYCVKTYAGLEFGPISIYLRKKTLNFAHARPSIQRSLKNALLSLECMTLPSSLNSFRHLLVFTRFTHLSCFASIYIYFVHFAFTCCCISKLTKKITYLLRELAPLVAGALAAPRQPSR